MRKRLWFWFKLLLLLLGLSLIALSDLKSRQHKLKLYPTQAELEAVLSGSPFIKRKEKPIPHYEGIIKINGKKRKAVALLTAELPPEIRGFNDQINILFSIDESGRIISVLPISHRESRYYFRLIEKSNFFKKLIGKKYDELGDIKTVTGATISSRAILSDLQTSAELAMSKIFGRKSQIKPFYSFSKIYLNIKIFSLVFVLFLGLVSKFYRKNWLRWTVFGVSFLVIGVWLKTILSLPHFFQLASLRINLTSNPYLVIMCGFAILSTIFWGPIWCGYLCPYAFLQELLGRAGRKFHWHISPRISRVMREVRWLILFALVVCYFTLRKTGFAEVEPFFHLFSRSWTLWGICLIIFTLAMSFFVPRFWCRFFCPTGAILLLLSSHRKILKGIEKVIKESKIDE